MEGVFELPASGTRVRCYKNLNNGKVSVQTNIPGKGWRVAGYCDTITLADAKFIVRETTRLRCIAKGQREVHAFVEGTITSHQEFLGRVSYNPFRGPDFTTTEGKPVHSAPFCTIERGYVWI